MADGSKGDGHPQELHGSPLTPLPSLQQQELDEFWRKTMEDIKNTMNFNNHKLPMTYVAKIIRHNQGDFMMSSDIPPILTKLSEIFIQELTVRAWTCASSHGRSSILESDIYEAVNSVDSYVFLNNVLLRHGTNYDQASMTSNVSQLQQESSTSTLIENDPTDVLYRSGEQAVQYPINSLDLTTNTQPNPLELKNDEDLNNATTTSSDSIKGTK